jgi:hypothetical protein
MNRCEKYFRSGFYYGLKVLLKAAQSGWLM